jgi:hypothetical protein
MIEHARRYRIEADVKYCHAHRRTLSNATGGLSGLRRAVPVRPLKKWMPQAVRSSKRRETGVRIDHATELLWLDTT